MWSRQALEVLQDTTPSSSLTKDQNLLAERTGFNTLVSIASMYHRRELVETFLESAISGKHAWVMRALTHYCQEELKPYISVSRICQAARLGAHREVSLLLPYATLTDADRAGISQAAHEFYNQTYRVLGLDLADSCQSSMLCQYFRAATEAGIKFQRPLALLESDRECAQLSTRLAVICSVLSDFNLSALETLHLFSCVEESRSLRDAIVSGLVTSAKDLQALVGGMARASKPHSSRL